MFQFQNVEIERLILSAIKKRSLYGRIMRHMSVEDFIAEVKSYIWIYPPKGGALSTAVYSHVLWTLGKISRKKVHCSLDREIAHEQEYKNPKETVDILLQCPDLTKVEQKVIKLRLTMKTPKEIAKSLGVTRQRLWQIEKVAHTKMRKYAETLGDRI